VVTVTSLGPNASNNVQAASSIPNAVYAYADGVIAGTETRFSMLNASSWVKAATSNDGHGFWGSIPTGGTDTIATGVVAFYTDAPIVMIGNRRSEPWQVLVDGKAVTSAVYNTPSGSGYGLTGTVLSFTTRKRRKFVAYGITTGFWGVAVGPSDTLEPVDLTKEVRITCMTDSYGGTQSAYYAGGAFWWAAARLGALGFYNSSGGGSGYDAPGNAAANYVTRLPTVAATSADIFLTAGGINDSATPVNCGAYFSSLRALKPTAVLVVTAAWTPNNTQRASGASRRDTILTALTPITGPWIFVDNFGGTWTAKTTAGVIKTGLIGYGPWQTGDGGQIIANAALVAATSATLTIAFPGTTGTYNLGFDDGSVKTATLTNNSTAVSWTGAVTAGINIEAWTTTRGNGGLYLTYDGTNPTHPDVQGTGWLGELLANGIQRGLLALASS